MNDTRTLIELARNAHPDAVRTLVERLMPVIQARVHRRLSRVPGRRLGGYDRDDLVQEIWLVLVKDRARQLAAWDPERGASLESYVGMIAERELGNVRARELESEKRNPARVEGELRDLDRLPTSSTSPQEEAEIRQVGEQLSRFVIQQLSSTGQMICRYLYADHLDPDRVAAIMGVSRQVVYNWQHKIKQLVMQFFAEHAR